MSFFRSSNEKLAFKVLLSEASVSLSDDITSPSGSVELLRLTLTKLLLSVAPAPASLPPDPTADPSKGTAPVSALIPDAFLIELHCSGLQVDNQLYNRASFHFPVLLCQEQRGGVEAGGPWSSDANPTESLEALEQFKRSCFLQLGLTLAGDGQTVEQVGFYSLSFICIFLSQYVLHFVTVHIFGKFKVHISNSHVFM